MIVNRQRKVRVAPRVLEKFLWRVERELGIDKADVTVCFVGDEEIARMNWEFRKKEGPTDVLSFPVQQHGRGRAFERAPFFLNTESANKRRKREQNGTRDTEGADSYLGDIAIAPGVARRYAKKNGRSLGSELKVLMLHGVLHLLGYDHETDSGEMEQLEQKLRRRFELG
jgi:probable rRNA maturation factor